MKQLRVEKPAAVNQPYSCAMQIRRFIDAHYHQDINLEILAKELSFSRSHLCHAFKAETGFSIVTYLRYRRVIAIRQHISRSDQGILDICYECGFNSLQNFYVTFRQVTGTTPGQFRKNGSPRANFPFQQHPD